MSMTGKISSMGNVKKNLFMAGKMFPYLQAGFSIPVVQFYKQEAKARYSFVTVYNVQIWFHFKNSKLDYFSARVAILHSIRLSSMKSTV
jgi:hypothetical protein